MDQDAIFLKRICDDPEDDALRREYATWLKDQGDERGEFILKSLALAALDEESDQFEGLARELQGLADIELHWWLNRFGKLIDVADFELTFHRGLPYALRVSSLTYDHELVVAGITRSFGEAPFQSLDLSPMALDGAALRTYLSMPVLPKLRELTLPCSGAEIFPVTAVSCARLDAIRVLILLGDEHVTPLPQIDWEMLMEAKWYPGLEELYIEHCCLTFSERPMPHDPASFRLRKLELESVMTDFSFDEAIELHSKLKDVTVNGMEY